jgi:hypothetical protein
VGRANTQVRPYGSSTILYFNKSGWWPRAWAVACILMKTARGCELCFYKSVCDAGLYFYKDGWCLW